jgi:MFS family permease
VAQKLASFIRRARLIALALGLIYLLECVAFVRTQSLTFDEPVHIAEGLDAWRNHRFAMWNDSDHPAFSRLWCTLPLLRSRWQMEVSRLSNGGWQVTRVEPDPESIAHRARYMNVILGLVLAATLWIAAMRMFSESAANFALALFVFSPSLIAHFSLATTDGAATLFIFAVAAYLISWSRKPGSRRTAVMGILMGLLLLAKFSTPVMFVLATFWMLVLMPGGFAWNPLRWNWGRTFGTIAIALLLVWAGYFFHVSRLTLRNHQLRVTFPQRAPTIYNHIHSDFNVDMPIPAGEFFEGFRNVVRRNRLGLPAFFLGRVSGTGGFRLYYPVSILLKWPAITLIVFASGLVLAVFRPQRVPSALWIMSTFPAAYLVFAVFARFNIGERHILPLYPFALLFAAYAWESARLRPLLLVALCLAVALQFADTLRCAPDYLSYFNIYVPSARSYEYLTDSNLDWGQGLLALREYVQAHPEERISLAYFGAIDPGFYGIHVQRLAEDQRASGTIIVSATNLSGQYLNHADSYRWLLQYPVTRILNHSLVVFDVPREPGSRGKTPPQSSSARP